MNSINSNNSAKSQTVTSPFPLQRIGAQKMVVGIIIVVVAAVILSFLLGAFNGFSAESESSQDPGDKVRIVSVNVASSNLVTSISKKRQYTGTIRAKQQASSVWVSSNASLSPLETTSPSSQ